LCSWLSYIIPIYNYHILLLFLWQQLASGAGLLATGIINTEIIEHEDAELA